MKIDTNELRKRANSLNPITGYQEESVRQIHLTADELDRLYAIEAANKPMTREQIEAWLKDHNCERSDDFDIDGAPCDEYWHESSRVKIQVYRNRDELSVFPQTERWEYQNIPFELVTPALLSALLK